MVGTSIISWSPFGKGFVKFDDINWTIFNIDNSDLESTGVLDIAIDAQGNKWVLSGEPDRLLKYDDEVMKNYYCQGYGDVYWCLTIDLEDNKWIGMNGYWGPVSEIGLIKLVDTTWTYYGTGNSSLPSLNITCMLVDRFNNKWIGTHNGLVVFNEGGIVSVEENESKKEIVPQKYFLNQNYPNPFNPSTTISYALPNQSYVSLKVFDVLGREVSMLVNREQAVGNYEVEFDASNLTSGIYFYKIKAGDFVETKKMILMK